MFIPVLFWLCVFMILYTYAGYPILIGLIAQFFPKQKPHSVYEPMVTLLIAAYNENASIAKKIENSLVQDYPREKLQILVAADGSEDGTDEVVRSFADRGVELSYSPERRGKMAAINRALPNARGEIVIMSDANNMYSKNTVRAMTAPFSDSSVNATSGAKAIFKDDVLSEAEGAYWKYESWIKKQESRIGCCTAAAGEVFAFRRTAFVSPPDYIINDDFYIMMSIVKQGGRVVYVPEALSSEHVSLTAQDEMARRTRIVAGRYQAIARSFEILPMRRPFIVWQVVSHKFLRPLVPFGMLGALAANTAIFLFPADGDVSAFFRLGFPFQWIFLALQLIFYVLAGIGERLKKLPFGNLLYLPAFLVNSNLAAVYGLFRFLTGKQSTRWTRVQRRENHHVG